MKYSFFIILFVLILTAALPVHAAGPTVTIRATGYDPVLLAVEPGTTVSWFNSDSRPHSVTADDGSFDSGGINAFIGGWSYTFTTAGRYAYHDGGDPSHTGLVIVDDTPLPTTYLPLMQAAPPPPPPLDQLMLQYPDISSAFVRTALEITPGTADDNYEAYLYVAYERDDTLFDGPLVLRQQLLRYPTPDAAAEVFADVAANGKPDDWQRAEMATVGDQSTAWTYAEVTDDGLTVRVFSVVAQHGPYLTLLFSGGLEGEVTTVSAYNLAIRAVARLP